MRRAARSIPLLLAGMALAGLTACRPAASPVSPAAAASAAVPRYTIEQILDLYGIFRLCLSHDASRALISADISGVYQAWSFATHETGEPRQLTEGAESVWVEGCFPADERLLFTSDRTGDELTHLYAREPDGKVTDLTPGTGLTAAFVGWSGDGRSILLTTNERVATELDLYAVSAVPGASYRRTLLYRNTHPAWSLAAVSRDLRWAAYAEMHSTLDRDVHLVDLRTGEARLLTPHTGDISYLARSFTPDGSGLLLLSDEGSEFRYLVRHDLATGERKVLFRPVWDVQEAFYSPVGRYLVVTVNADAATKVQLFEAATMSPVELPGLPEKADIGGLTVSQDDRTLAFFASTSRLPRDVWTYDLEKRGGLRRITDSLKGPVDTAHLVEGEVVRFTAPDGVVVPGILYKPHGAGPDHKVPAVVYVHGGPGEQSRLGFSALIQYLVNQGYAVYAINHRGSEGYGRTFFGLDDRRHGEADLDDCVASKKRLAATGWIDPDRVAILGGSYGGYLVLAALTFRPTEFAAGVDLFGVSNWVRTLGSLRASRESVRQALIQEMGDFEDEAYFRRISPLFHADSIVRPLMVLQGARDPRVLQAESDDIVAAARANGTPVEYLVFEDEGHGFVKRQNRESGYGAIARFLDRHLKK